MKPKRFYWEHRDRKHWEIRVGPIMIDRWCKGAPCSLIGYTGKHPVHLTIARAGQ